MAAAHRNASSQSDLAADRRVRQRYGVLSRALLAGASRSCVTRPRPAAICCSEPAATISMRSQSPATSAAPAPAARALAGFNRIHAILGGSDTASRRLRRYAVGCGRSMPGWRRSKRGPNKEAIPIGSSIACPAKLQRSRHRSSRVIINLGDAAHRRLPACSLPQGPHRASTPLRWFPSPRSSIAYMEDPLGLGSRSRTGSKTLAIAAADKPWSMPRRTNYLHATADRGSRGRAGIRGNGFQDTAWRGVRCIACCPR